MNLTCVGWQFKLINGFVRTLKYTFYSQNKTHFFYFFVDGFYLKGFALLILTLIPIRLSLTGACLMIFGAKYWQLFLQDLHFKGRLFIFNNYLNKVKRLIFKIKKLKTRIFPETLKKTILSFEIEKRKLGSWKSKDRSFNLEEINDSLPLDWRWVSSWRCEIFANCDIDGWIYSGSILQKLIREPKENLGTRTRVWKRDCEKLI